MLVSLHNRHKHFRGILTKVLGSSFGNLSATNSNNSIRDRCALRAARMGRRQAHGDSVMNTSDRSDLESLQDSTVDNSDIGEEPSSLDSCRLLGGDKRRRHAEESGSMAGPMQGQTSPVEVKKHQHKHNLKHRYEVMETLGKGTYGKVKRAVDRSSRKTVSYCLFLHQMT